jgi:methionine sulfoxide reductase heme-binding subunit
MTIRTRLLKPLVFAAAATPGAVLAWDAARGGLGADPVAALLHRTGWWALTMLFITLAVTPIRRVTGWNGVIRVRRMLGLFAFFYATTHFCVYVGLDQFFALSFILEDVTKRPYITIGFTALLILSALAFTSTKGWVRRLGKRWQRLHRLVYIAALAGVVHFYWQVKADTREPLIFATILAALFVARLRPRRPPRRPAPARAQRRADPDTAEVPS